MPWDSEFGCRTCHKRVATSRGCCIRCYRQWYERVRAGQTTWAALEQLGKALAPRPDSKRRWGGGRL